MVSGLREIARLQVSGLAGLDPKILDQWQRLEQAARCSMVAFESEEDLQGQIPPCAELWQAEDAAQRNLPGKARGMASLIDDCAAVVTSYLRPAF